MATERVAPSHRIPRNPDIVACLFQLAIPNYAASFTSVPNNTKEICKTTNYRKLVTKDKDLWVLTV
jgi:hypothetical protein